MLRKTVKSFDSLGVINDRVGLPSAAAAAAAAAAITIGAILLAADDRRRSAGTGVVGTGS